jgi:hypothetical protein
MWLQYAWCFRLDCILSLLSNMLETATRLAVRPKVRSNEGERKLLRISHFFPKKKYLLHGVWNIEKTVIVTDAIIVVGSRFDGVGQYYLRRASFMRHGSSTDAHQMRFDVLFVRLGHTVTSVRMMMPTTRKQ